MQQPGSESLAEIWRVGILLEASFLQQLQESPLRVLACPAPSNSFSLDEGDAIAVCKQHLLGTYEHANEYTTPGVGSEGYELKESQLKHCKHPSVAIAAVEVLDTSVEELGVQLKVDLTTFTVCIGLSRPVTATLLLVSRHFLKVYGLFSQESVWFRRLTPVPLNRVTLVPVLEGTATLSEQQIEESVQELYIQRKTITVQQGFNLVFQVRRSPSGESSMDCVTTFAVTGASPVLQGKITDQTVITVLPPDPSCPSSPSKPRRRVSGKKVSKTPVREDSDGEMYFDAEDVVGNWRRTGSGGSASDFPHEPSSLSLPESSGDYHTQVTAVGDFRLQSQYIVLPKDAATMHSVYHCQTVWVCAAREEERSNRALSNLVLPLHYGPGVKAEKEEGEEEEEEEGERMHLAVAILYENDSELEKYVPPGALGGPSDRSAQGHAFIHPNLLFFLFPETLSSTRKFFVTIKRIRDPEIPLVKSCRISHVQYPVKQTVDLKETFMQYFVDKSFLLSVGEVLSIPTNSGKIYGIVEALEPSMNGAAALGKVWDCSIPAEKSSSYLPDLVPPSPLFSTPSYWEQLQPAGLEGYCETLFSYFIPLLGGQLAIRPPSSVLVSGPPGSGKKLVVRAVARQCRMHVLECNCYEFSSDVVAYAEKSFVHYFTAAFDSVPVVLIMNQVHMLGRKSDTQEEVRLSVEFEKAMGEISKFNRTGHYPVMVVGVTSRPHSVPLRVHGSFLHHLEVAAPSQPQRAAMLTALARENHLSPEIDFEDLAKRTAGFVLGDFVALFSHASHLAFRDVAKHCLSSLGWHTNEDLAIAGVVVTQLHMETALATLHSAHSDAIGAPKIPSVRWEDVGGLAEAKQEILDTIQLPLLHPELFTAGLRRSGVLLYGAPGTGKTLLAKAVATECSLNFLSVKGPELINMYVGQSEENIREVFTRARGAAPCVIFFDELDSIAPNRGKSGDSGGVMDRVVSQLLSELDGLQRLEDVFVIGATNRPDLLDPALLRPGRFDRLVYLGVSEDMEAKLKILNAITRKFNLSESVDLSVVASRCPSNLTGADLYALCSDATLIALRRQIDSMEQQGMSDDEWEGVLAVTQDDFLEALEKLVPSVSPEELQRYKDIKKTMAS